MDTRRKFILVGRPIYLLFGRNANSCQTLWMGHYRLIWIFCRFFSLFHPYSSRLETRTKESIGRARYRVCSFEYTTMQVNGIMPLSCFLSCICTAVETKPAVNGHLLVPRRRLSPWVWNCALPQHQGWQHCPFGMFCVGAFGLSEPHNDSVHYLFSVHESNAFLEL